MTENYSMKSKKCKVVFVNLEPEEKIKYGSLQITKDGKIKWNRPKGKAEKEKAEQEIIDR